MVRDRITLFQTLSYSIKSWKYKFIRINLIPQQKESNTFFCFKEKNNKSSRKTSDVHENEDCQCIFIDMKKGLKDLSENTTNFLEKEVPVYQKFC